MDINKILAEYDAMFGKYSLAEIEEFLKRNLQQAEQQNENKICVTLLNEIIGLCRDTSQREKALSYCNDLRQLVDSMGLAGTVEHATALLNIANAYRAFGLLNEASDYYVQVLNAYDNNFGTPGFLYASLYNNWSHVYQEKGDYARAKDLLKKALDLLMSGNGDEIMQATTRVNLANAMMKIGSEYDFHEAMKHLQQALYIFENDGGRDFHYSAVLVALGDAYAYRKQWQMAADYYGRGLAEIEKHTGRNVNYDKTLKKLNDVKAKIAAADTAYVAEYGVVTGKGSNMARSKAFYEQYGRDMIHCEFPEYEMRIAVGVAGEGSDCFGFDDEISADHDYGAGFCMWLTEEDNEKIGKQLQAAYDKLVQRVYKYKQVDRFLQERRGVSTISGFYNRILRTSCDFQNGCRENFYGVSECQLAAATNGEVFRDDLGIFTGVRKKLLEHYPEEVFRKKLVQELHEFSQYAQSNYPRMMARGDQLTANLCVSKAVESAMNMCYLLHREYAPYYKWKRKGLDALSDNKMFRYYLDEIAVTPCQMEAWKGVAFSPVTLNTKDRIVVLFESVAQELVNALHRRGYVHDTEELFLEALIPEVLKTEISEPEQYQEHECRASYRDDLISNVMALEWKQFDKVHNEGGRADCQDDYETFRIMRLSQYMTWPEELLESYYEDLKTAEDRGWNLIMEKYARMMRNTDPVKYRTVEDKLPVLTAERERLQEAVIGIQVGWMESFASRYPKLAGGSRSIYSKDDSTYNTSYETYLRGEISTYSQKTFVIYAGFVSGMLNAGRNLTEEIMENTVVLYGYTSLDDAEKKK